MIDTHCHLTFEQFAGRVDQVLADARAVGVRGVITVSTTPEDAMNALAIAQRHANVWCSAGVHPLYSDEVMQARREGGEGHGHAAASLIRDSDWELIRRVGSDAKCVAWGELGLDNHYKQPPRVMQQAVLAAQLDLLEALASDGVVKPIIVHCREAFDDLIAIFRERSLEPSRYVFHCFTGGPEEARKVLDFGAWISFTGVVTFRNAPEVARAAKMAPLERIMVETDSPFLSPEPVRTVRPNEPKFVVHVAEFIAKLRGMDPRELERQLDANAERFFGITLGE
jgi:TatD DNase family protein